jgi:hypothetical protein
MFHPRQGLSLQQRAEVQASEVQDFDGIARVEPRLPGQLILDEQDWRDRQSVEAVMAHFETLYQTRPRSVEPVLLPLWRLHFQRPDRPGMRIATLDALAGMTIDW